MDEQDTASTTVTRTLLIRNRYGLHARPAALFVETCNRYQADIALVRDDNRVNAKNILDVMMLGAGMGTELELHAAGEDAEAAAEALVKLVESNFGEGA